MAGETILTVCGGLTSAPEMRFIASGKAVANFNLASTPRAFDKASGEWKDGDTLYWRCNIWGKPAENVCESLDKGSQVVVTGRLKLRSFEKDGQKRSVMELEVDDIGVSLKFAAVQTMRNQGQGSADPWASPPPPASPDDHDLAPF